MEDVNDGLLLGAKPFQMRSLASMWTFGFASNASSSFYRHVTTNYRRTRIPGEYTI
jgi:hypothetical protein